MIGRFLFIFTKKNISSFEFFMLFLFFIFMAPIFSGDLNWKGHALLILSATGTVGAASFFNSLIHAFAIDLVK